MHRRALCGIATKNGLEHEQNILFRAEAFANGCPRCLSLSFKFHIEWTFIQFKSYQVAEEKKYDAEEKWNTPAERIKLFFTHGISNNIDDAKTENVRSTIRLIRVIRANNQCSAT